MMTAMTNQFGGAERMRSTKLPATLPAGCCSGIKVAMVCSVIAAIRTTAIKKWKNSRILQKELLPRKSVIASMASPPFITSRFSRVMVGLSLGLSPTIVSELFDVVRDVVAAGVTCVLVEQSLSIAAELCDRAVFLEKGAVRFDGAPDELLRRGDLARAVFLGGQR